MNFTFFSLSHSVIWLCFALMTYSFVFGCYGFVVFSLSNLNGNSTNLVFKCHNMNDPVHGVYII